MLLVSIFKKKLVTSLLFRQRGKNQDFQNNISKIILHEKFYKEINSKYTKEYQNCTFNFLSLYYVTVKVLQYVLCTIPVLTKNGFSYVSNEPTVETRSHIFFRLNFTEKLVSWKLHSSKLIPFWHLVKN